MPLLLAPNQLYNIRSTYIYIYIFKRQFRFKAWCFGEVGKSSRSIDMCVCDVRWKGFGSDNRYWCDGNQATVHTRLITEPLMLHADWLAAGAGSHGQWSGRTECLGTIGQYIPGECLISLSLFLPMIVYATRSILTRTTNYNSRNSGWGDISWML